jgi:hypothetical protein
MAAAQNQQQQHQNAIRETFHFHCHLTWASGNNAAPLGNNVIRNVI